MKYLAKCHCGAVQAEVEADESIECLQCNCSICSLVADLHLILPKTRFKLLCGEESITTYTFNTKVAKHTFCKHCGVKVFYTPRSNPDGISVNARCLIPQPKSIKVKSFDGQNWEKHAGTVAHLSKSG